MHAWLCRECRFEIIFGLARFFLSDFQAQA